MNLLTVDHITKVYTQRELFHDASFYLQDGEKVGIIGINGTGKSTLLKIMAGLEEPDAGNVVRTNHLVIRYLPQMPEFDPQKGALENVLSYAQIGSVHQQEDREEHEKWNLGMGKTTVELSHITKTYGDHVLISDFSYIFLKNDRIGFVGKNGCGKTTLMKIIDGRILPDAGEVTIGQTIKIGYYTQEIEQDENAGIAYMDPKLRVIDYIKNTAEYVRTEDGLVSASAMLDKFLFPPEEQYGQIKKLSGGEKRRLNLLRVLMEAPNVLILDEPTNDLDITTLTILEDYLDHYDGIVITVSHDRYFLDRVVHRIFAFEGNGKLCQYEGGYTDYHRRAEEEGKFVDTAGDSFRKNEETANVQEKQATEDSRSTWKHENKLKFSYKEQKEYETIEDDIAALETRLGEIDGEMASCARDFVKLNELTEEKTQLETQLEEKMDRWTYLEELAAKILQQNA